VPLRIAVQAELPHQAQHVIGQGAEFENQRVRRKLGPLAGSCG
jgi:hypothetical protein